MYRVYLLVPLLALAGACRESRDHGGPNVIMIVLDTVRGDRCTVNGYGRPTTPGLGRIAETGVVFRDAWSPAAWTAPAHASLFTGLRPENHGLLTGNRVYLEREAVTLAEILSRAGYRTACLTNNVWISPEFGLTQGFAELRSIVDRPDEEYPTCRWVHRRALEVAREARDDGQPFFVFVNDMEAHLPYTPLPAEEARFVAPGTPRELVAECRSFEPDDAARHMAGEVRVSRESAAVLSDLYDAEIAGLDAEVEKLVLALEADGLLSETVLVITSDHGENLGDHGLFGHKADLHRSLRHVPLLVRYPGRFEGGRVVDETVRLEDLFPTLLELCGLEVPDGTDGASLCRELPGRVARGAYGRAGGNLDVPEAPPHVDLSRFALSFRAVYEGRHDLIRHSNGREELFDVRADPLERNDLAEAEPDVRDRLRRLLPDR